VDETGIEPATFSVGTGTLSCAICRSELQRDFGGRDRDRTGDLIVANDALSQLSYSPTSSNTRNFSRVEEKIPTEEEFVLWQVGQEADGLGRPSLQG
jgi:hypothetical protein